MGKDSEIERIGIVIIQYLNRGDQPQGRLLYENLKSIEKENPQYFVNYYEANSRDEFKQALEDVNSRVKENTILTIHIDGHAGEFGIGPVVPINAISWEEFHNLIRPINIKTENTLMLVLSICEGGAILSTINPEERAPYMAFIGNLRPITFHDADRGFMAFYKTFRNPLDFPKSLDALNAEIDYSTPLPDGREKAPFFVFSAKEQFEQVFNPDRDPVNFDKIVEQHEPESTGLPLNVRQDKVREWFRKEADRYRDYFNFQSDVKPQ